MIIQCDDLLGNRDFYDFIALFDKEFVLRGRIYSFSLLCTSADNYKELSNALRAIAIAYGRDNFSCFVNGDSDESLFVDVICHIPKGKTSSEICDYLRQSFTVAAEIDGPARLCHQCFTAYETPFFESYESVLNSIGRLSLSVKENKFIGNLSHPKKAEDGTIIDWNEHSSLSEGVGFHDRFTVQEDLSINMINVYFAIGQDVELSAELARLTQRMRPKWRENKELMADSRRLEAWEWTRKNDISEALEVLQIYKCTSESRTKTILKMHEDSLLGSFDRHYSVIPRTVPSRCIGLLLFSKDKANLTLLEDKNINITDKDSFKRIISVSFDFLSK